VTGKTDKSKLTDEQKTRLLGLALEPQTSASGNTDEAKGDLLCDILRCPLPATDHPSDITRGVATGFGSALGPSLGQLLTDPKTEVTVLSRIKEYAKSLGSHATGELEKDVLLAVYFAAIAAAIVFHGQRITEHLQMNLAQFLHSYANAAWTPSGLVDLFKKASLLCEGAKRPRGV